MSAARPDGLVPDSAEVDQGQVGAESRTARIPAESEAARRVAASRRGSPAFGGRGRAVAGGRLRILQVAPPWFPVPPPRYGGTEQVVGVLSEGLVARGHDVTVVTTGEATVGARRIAPFVRAPVEQIGNWQVELRHLLVAYAAAHRFDVVHDHTLLGAALSTLSAGTAARVHTLHGQWTAESAAVCRDIGSAVALVGISHDQVGRAPEGMPIHGVVHNGIDISRFPFTATSGSHLAFIGRASPEKAPHLAVEVARRLGRRLVMGVKINEPRERAYWRDVVVPAIGDHDVEVVENADHEQKVRIVGSARCVLFPIQWPEPFGLVPVEANACGTPVVAFANGAVPEVVADGTSGVLVPPGHGVAGLAAAVEAAEAMDRRACRGHVLHRFGADRMVDGYEAVYRQVLARRPRAAPGARTPGMSVAG